MKTLTTFDLNDMFSNHVVSATDGEKMNVIREAGRQLAEVILNNTPANADQSAAIRKVREAVMTANAAIAMTVKENESIVKGED